MSFLSSSRRIAGAALTVGLLTLGAGAAAATTPTPPPPTSSPSESGTSEGPQTYTGSTIDITSDIDGDVYVAGQNVTISGDITGDVIAAAQTITITGTIDGDVRLAAQTITLSGEITRSGTVFAADVTLTDTGSFGDDMVGAASTIDIAGTVGRDVLIGVDRLTIDGTVGGDVTYSSDDDASIADGAVAGTTQRIAPPESAEVEVSPWAVFAGWLLGLLYALIALSLITLVAGLLAPRVLNRVTDHLVPSPWKALLVGFIAANVVPAALLFLLVTVIGAPLALAGMLVWTVLTLATFVYGAHYLGRLILRRSTHPVVQTLVGGAILITALQIPWLNILVVVAMISFGLGAQLLEFYRRRPWAARPVPAATYRAAEASPTTP
ncbi:hypothetical protein [Herbiconiux liangxiaofengii]|uniref:hypothetical protein n=1 Tax=Herbiconiux liangxiaofengii TaxID=3342795 RepID=UPI0035B6D52B